MGLAFKLRDFADPIALIALKRRFDRNEHLCREALMAYQAQRLKAIASHAYENVPYYGRLFDDHAVRPSEMDDPSQLARIPLLTKEILSRSFSELTAVNARAHRPMALKTSGTTGSAIKFLVDRPSNLLEFVYYWRFWGWHGYRLGDRFAEFSAESFTPIAQHRTTLFRYSRLTNRVLVNSLLLSKSNLAGYIEMFHSFKPRFLKGLPSTLYAFALLCRQAGHRRIGFRAIFSQGENLLQCQRTLIEDVFSCPIYDSYGHMERTVAISQCQHGRYHVHGDYGYVEFIRPESQLAHSVRLGSSESLLEIVSTSLHNLSMPLLRYKTRDLAVVDSEQTECPCQRRFPLVRSIIGRDTDIVVTPDGRVITALYVAFDRLPEVACGQIVQESLKRLIVRVAPQAGADRTRLLDAISNTIHSFTGTSMEVVVRFHELDELYKGGAKFKTVVSHVDPRIVTQ